MTPSKKASLISVCVLFMALTSACTSAPIDENNPEELFKDAEEEIQNDHYLVAIEKLKSIKNRFPYSNYSLESHLRIADIFFLQELFDEAAATYESFVDLHPRHPKAAYAMFKVGKSYMNNIPSKIDRDLTSAEKSLKSYEAFIKRFPQAPEAIEARQDIQGIRTLMASKELMIGDFYLKRKHPDSAKNRYKKILELYSETDVAKIAQEKLDKISNSELNEGELQSHGSK